MDQKEEVVLVDEEDNKQGTEEKLKAHKNGGKLHRAISIFILNSKGEMLLQKRAESKYHFPGLWSNAVCSHPRKGETPKEGAERRLEEEFGFTTDLEKLTEFVYKAQDESSGLTEYEYDHTFIGTYNGTPDPNPKEIGDYKWISEQDLRKDVENNPEKYTPWFKKIYKRVLRKKG